MVAYYFFAFFLAGFFFVLFFAAFFLVAIVFSSAPSICLVSGIGTEKFIAANFSAINYFFYNPFFIFKSILSFFSHFSSRHKTQDWSRPLAEKC